MLSLMLLKIHFRRRISRIMANKEPQKLTFIKATVARIVKTNFFRILEIKQRLAKICDCLLKKK